MDQGNVQHGNTKQHRRARHAGAISTAAAENVTAHRYEDRNKSEEAVIEAEATTKAFDPANVGLVLVACRACGTPGRNQSRGTRN